MKKIIVLSVIIFISASNFIFSQDDMGGDRRMHPPLEKIQQLEKAKIIEILDLPEETAIRFFARRKEFRDKQHNLFVQREKMINNAEEKIKNKDNISDKESRELLSNIVSLDMDFARSREKFYSSLNDLLSPQQILKLAVFDNRFMREIRDLLAGRKKGKPD